VQPVAIDKESVMNPTSPHRELPSEQAPGHYGPGYGDTAEHHGSDAAIEQSPHGKERRPHARPRDEREPGEEPRTGLGSRPDGAPTENTDTFFERS
jgi:hypothetical protein